METEESLITLSTFLSYYSNTSTLTSLYRTCKTKRMHVMVNGHYVYDERRDLKTANLLFQCLHANKNPKKNSTSMHICYNFCTRYSIYSVYGILRLRFVWIYRKKQEGTPQVSVSLLNLICCNDKWEKLTILSGDPSFCRRQSTNNFDIKFTDRLFRRQTIDLKQFSLQQWSP